jgi:hypothetical protein
VQKYPTTPARLATYVADSGKNCEGVGKDAVWASGFRKTLNRGPLHLDLRATYPETRLRFMVEVAKLLAPKLSNVTLDDFREKSPFTSIIIDVVD